MQHPSTNIIKSVCTSPSGASSSNPVVIIETYMDGTEWYRKYSDGTIEQGGWGNDLVNGQEVTHNFVTAFTDASSVSVHFTFISTSSYSGDRGGLGLGSNTTSTFNVHCDTRTDNSNGYYWVARGV